VYSLFWEKCLSAEIQFGGCQKKLRFQCHTRNQATYFQGAYSGEHRATIGNQGNSLRAEVLGASWAQGFVSGECIQELEDEK